MIFPLVGVISCPHLKAKTPSSPLYLETMALVLSIKAAQLLDGLASDLPARLLIELQLLANMHPTQDQ